MNSLFVAWRPPMPDWSGWRPVGKLEHDGDFYRFWYTQGAQKRPFRAFSQMERLDQIYESEELFPLFSNRLLPKSRPEYEAYLRWSGFDIAVPPDPFLVLGVTEGIRQTDAVEVFPCPAPNAEGCYLTKFFLHGVQWRSQMVVERIGRLKVDERLKLMLDLQNEADPNAVALRTEFDSMKIGYLPRYLAHDVRQLNCKCDIDYFELFVERVNRDAPLQNRVLCRMNACWPEGFQPCSGEDFLPIPIGVSTACTQ